MARRTLRLRAARARRVRLASLAAPLDVLGFAFVYSFMLVVVAGVTPEAALIANLAATFRSFFQHANIRTHQLQ